ncbi:hypothetical protein TALK_18900 [Thalassospira alkalitolerans]|uniref:Uncharacterized protein n=1 Tax=Thalassospira alkalitolerans TaxID=1293890 RepID=A0A1Y2L8R8_9PROT|nr:hypothetical protein TALK_18900 [Thalassospira alkalitolerans]
MPVSQTSDHAISAVAFSGYPPTIHTPAWFFDHLSRQDYVLDAAKAIVALFLMLEKSDGFCIFRARPLYVSAVGGLSRDAALHRKPE